MAGEFHKKRPYFTGLENKLALRNTMRKRPVKTVSFLSGVYAYM